MHRLASLAKLWIHTCPRDFDSEEVKGMWERFVEVVATSNPEGYTDKFIARPTIDELKEDGVDMAGFDILSYPCKTIAKCLTLIDFDFFSKVRRADLIRFSDGHEYFECTARQFVERCNAIGYWVGSTILAERHSKKRAKIIEKFIAIAKHCAKLKNFSACMVL